MSVKEHTTRYDDLQSPSFVLLGFSLSCNRRISLSKYLIAVSELAVSDGTTLLFQFREDCDVLVTIIDLHNTIEV